MKVLNFKVHKSHADFTSIQILYWCLEIQAFLWNFHKNPIYLLYNFKGLNYSAWFVFSVALKLIWCFPKLCWIVCDLPPLLQMSLFKILILRSQEKKRSMYVWQRVEDSRQRLLRWEKRTPGKSFKTCLKTKKLPNEQMYSKRGFPYTSLCIM